ncbi:hypothetical protein [Pseudoalteromonas tetraodonis]|uniref:hypothetical protein n=1 Tax=Pseudoalteromonas tetraodonis TaxID=43659 RepID=UPI000849D416|nr:hypothetical protein [Pseudoalteromonas tetraodonis]ODS13953.1 hypothetical protein BCD66_08380 [Pseudoalteromonas tetraodonis]
MLNFLHAKSHNVTADFTHINWHELKLKVKSPQDLGALTSKEAKAKSAVIAATDAPNKTKETILLHDNFTLLRLDLDDTTLDIDSISDMLEGMSIESYIIHTTASHQQGGKGKRYRIYIELAASITYAVWALVESYLSYVFMADDCATRPQQIMYLPVRIIGDSYEYKIGEGEPLYIPKSQILVDAKALEVEQTKQQAEQLAAAKTAPIKPAYKQNLVGKQISIINLVNNGYRWESLLGHYGYKQQGKAYLPPEATSKTAGAYILTSHTDGKERYYSHHESDPCGTGQCQDMFDFIVIREYGGDYKRALHNIAKTQFKQIHKHNQQEYFTHLHNESVNTFFAGGEK